MHKLYLGLRARLDDTARRNATAMLNWRISLECRKMARGDWRNITFFKDIQRMEGSLKLGNIILSTDFRTARNQIASFVTKGAKNDYGALTGWSPPATPPKRT